MVSRNLIILTVAAIAVIVIGAAIYFSTIPPPVTSKLKVAVLLPGSITDAGFNAAMYTAAQSVSTEMNDTIAMSIAEGLGQVGLQPTLQDYAGRGYKLIFAWSWNYQDSCNRVTPDFPDVWFILPGASQTNGNVISALPQLWDGAYLAGMVAASVSNTSKLGAVGGYSDTFSVAVLEAFIAGGQRVNPNINGTCIYAGVWDDVGKGREAGEALIGAGADVLFSRGDGLTLGVIQAASMHSAPGTSKTVYMVGDIADQHALAPKTIITSNITPDGPLIKNVIAMYNNGTLAANRDNDVRSYFWGLKYGVSDITPFYALDYKVPANIKAQVADVRKAILNGSFTVPVLGRIH
ncbi:MAG TPA: BMP family protein [Candidatus Bathyarchaeia archaeon]|nr:BMP family protein [Candidatus Bathyarchaeia archaeon]